MDHTYDNSSLTGPVPIHFNYKEKHKADHFSKFTFLFSSEVSRVTHVNMKVNKQWQTHHNLAM